MRLGELNWMEIEAYLKKDDRLIVVLGSTEQHGYLSVNTDVKVPLSLQTRLHNKREYWWRHRCTLAIPLIFWHILVRSAYGLKHSLQSVKILSDLFIVRVSNGY